MAMLLSAVSALVKRHLALRKIVGILGVSERMRRVRVVPITDRSTMSCLRKVRVV